MGVRNIGHANASHTNDMERKPSPAINQASPEGERERRALGEAIVRSQTEKFITDGIALGYRCDPSPLIWPDGSPTPVDTVVDYHPTSLPGSRAPHAWVAEDRSTIDLYGRGFVLLHFDRTLDTASVERAFAQRGAPLSVMPIANPEIAALYARRLVLVRPDGHVAWRSDDLPTHPLALADRVRGA